MVTLSGEGIFLRALEPEDLDFLYRLENDETVWEVSETQAPYSRYLLRQYLENSHKDIYEIKQLRLAISDYSLHLLGFIDLFDFCPKNRRAGVGIVVFEKAQRSRGIGSEALRLLTDYAFTRLGVHQLYANITADNTASIRLFTRQGFEKVGVKKDWIFSEGEFRDEVLYQKIGG
ncbi:GNAT family N-acetyltransferase [Sinomicrobium soli]|uniref:GNAT family N-acetyltransferase n=1 Tax=Sinomicrobium sp. N-1-3-6 TaxID=2219864 RepID=UPI000DCDA673|nr:GNAT family protein [Sinomicrobium sp. N-1-3-6]RAV29983.1 GNAT family N-acetyltransferase [Sinomicrobium sp. N-1-3-6]